MDVPPQELLTSLLKAVSRSFYLTLRVLPAAIRPQIGLAYLLARTTDTVADTGLVAPVARLEALAGLRERIAGFSSKPLAFGELAAKQGLPAERILLENAEGALNLLDDLDATDRDLVREVLRVIVGGQELDLRRFANASASAIVALKTVEDLNDYTYRVAGCVGEFWTKMCRRHLFPRAAVDEALLLSNGVRFGKGLQLVNILRDLPADLRQGRCYVPADLLGRAGLVPTDLLEAATEPRFRPVYDSLLDRAESNLRAGWAYTNGLPRGLARVRLACAWPVLIGLETVGRLRRENVLDASRRIKVSRREIRGMILKSLLLYPFPSPWRSLVQETEGEQKVKVE